MPYDKQCVPAAMEFPTVAADRVINVDLRGCCGLIVAAAPSADATLVVRSGGQDVSFTLYAPNETEGAVTSYPWRLDMQIDQIITGTTAGLEDSIILLKGAA